MCGLQQQPRIVGLRSFEQIVSRTLFNDVTLLHHKNIVEKQRILIFSETGFAERINATSLLLKDLHKSGQIREVQMRELWFLAQGGAAPLHFHALSQMFDQFDGPINTSELIERMTDAIMRSLMK